ncbi:RNF41 [Bugula neritina]|uniref:E3 ubiquitin-protein ligase NRDP1 n=1 Tax=Bugula neritina TaxID=10212 RepID=A0A7J7K0R1_BUGNE|nr:RNF41 [Bugula neritina]
MGYHNHRVAPQCEHAFCAACINEWLTRQPTCPVDRAAISPADLKPVPRILRNLLARLTIKCENAAQGCTASIKLDSLASHLNECEFNPKKPVSCELGCGSTIPKDELSTHNCVKELRSALQASNNKLTNVQIQVTDLKNQLKDQDREIRMLKEFMRAMRNSNPRIREIHADVENDEILRWVSTLQPARVGWYDIHPDAVLQAVIKRALIDSGCPDHIIQELMENAHERRWPPGLCTLETRQLHRRQYENYVTKRIPGKQAVIVMACENQHVADDMIMEPGLVMIFAHGVE